MGVGKSTVGPRLARRLGLPFFDLDRLIAQQAGQSIAAIFETEGEAAFRRREAQTVRALGQRPPMVVALGGGTLHHHDNRDVLASAFAVVVLHAEWPVLQRRLSTRDPDRPLWAQAAALYRQRRAGYLNAGAVVRVDERTPDEVVDAVIEVLGC